MMRQCISSRFISLIFTVSLFLVSSFFGATNTLRPYNSCFTALFKLEKVHKSEGRIVNALLKHYEDFDQDLWSDEDKTIYESLIKIKNDREVETANNLIHHPVDQFHFLKRVVKITNPMLESFSNLLKDAKFLAHVSDSKKAKDLKTAFEELLKKIRKYHLDTTCWPGEPDYDFALNSLVELTKVYQLSKSELAKGEILGHKAVHQLSVEDIMDIVETCDKLYYYQQIIDWCKFLIEDRIQSQKEIGETYTRRIYRMLANNYFKNNQIDEAIEVLENLIKSGKTDKKYQTDLAFFKEKKEANVKYPKPDKELGYNQTYNELYDELCRSADKNPILGCKYTRPMLGWYLVKEEILSLKPFIKQYHDVIFPLERRAMRELAKTRMFIPGIDNQNGKEVLNKGKIHQAGYLQVSKVAVVEEVEKRLEFITGLNIFNFHQHKFPQWNEVTSENFYVTNYGLANKEGSVMDVIDSKLRRLWPDNRIATLQFDVSEEDINGGATIFPKISISVFPKKGSAILWYNLHRNGKHNMDTVHAQCPVLYGSKWTSTKWIHERKQFLIRPCSLNSKF